MTTGTATERSPRKGLPRWAGWAIAVVAVLLVLLPILVSVYTDWLWFGEVDFRGVFGRVIVARIALFIVFALIAAAVTWAAGYLTWRNRPRGQSFDDLNSAVGRYRQMLENSARILLIGLPIIAGLIAGFLGQQNWRTVLMFLFGGEFGSQDAEFGNDLGFYAFTLPFLQLVQSTISVLLIVAFVLSLVGYYLLGGIRIGDRAADRKGTVSKPCRVQLAVIGGLWLLNLVFGFWLSRFSLLYNQNQTFAGASYTDLHAQLPAYLIMMVIGAIVAASFFAAVVIKDLRIPALGVALLLISQIVISGAWPLLLENFSVNPNRAAKESESIRRNIEATREAYGLTDEDVTYIENWGTDDAPEDEEADEVANDEGTISNIRLLDPDVLNPTFTQQQQLRNFYGFPEQLAVDRYETDGELRDYVVAAREIDPNALQENQSNWINRHTVYTHGNGFIAAPANKVDEVARDAGSARGGYPVYTISDLQTNQNEQASKRAEELGIKVDQPRIYFGPVIASAQDGADYAVVGEAGAGEVEYDTDDETFTYDGEGGVDIGNWINRAAFALRYQEINLILSDRVGGDSKIIFDRDPRQRVEKVAPWLTTDSKTYPAVVDGRLTWIVDGYTTLDKLPYSTPTQLEDATEDALNPDGTNQRLINNEVSYIRNSVKATVDAYDGTVTLYEFDDEDPVLKAWEKIFPDTVTPKEEISEDLHAHLRYPEDLFKVQRELLARYHVDDPGVFFTNDAFWSVPGDPTAPEGQQELAQPPYYVIATDPDTGEPSFQLITPFRGLQREFLSAHMSVSSNPENYGDITVRVLPTETQKQGPKQAQDEMMSSDQIARDRTLWEGTNDLYNGNLLTLPVGDGEILYVEPVYSQRKNQESAFPKLLRVLVSYNRDVGYAPTISEALEQVGIDSEKAQEITEIQGDSGGDQPTANDLGQLEGSAGGGDDDDDADDADEEKESGSRGGSAPAGGSGDEGEAIQRINDALSNLESARNGSFEDFGAALDELDEAVKDYQDRFQN